MNEETAEEPGERLARKICGYDGMARDTVDKFTKYMQANPHYFRFVYRAEATESNIRYAWLRNHSRRKLRKVKASQPKPRVTKLNLDPEMLKRMFTQKTDTRKREGYNVCPNCKTVHKSTNYLCSLCRKWNGNKTFLKQIAIAREAGTIRRGSYSWRKVPVV